MLAERAAKDGGVNVGVELEVETVVVGPGADIDGGGASPIPEINPGVGAGGW